MCCDTGVRESWHRWPSVPAVPPHTEGVATQVCVSRGTDGRLCQLCRLKDPLPKQSFIDHIMGKKHRIAEHKQSLTGQQKIDRDARTLHVRGVEKFTC